MRQIFFKFNLLLIINTMNKNIKIRLFSVWSIGKKKFNTSDIKERKIAPKKAISHIWLISKFFFLFTQIPEAISMKEETHE